MGHVDHGKTLLLDRIRSTDVVAGEAGGITQHIGAYQVERNGQLITFIDTPATRPSRPCAPARRDHRHRGARRRRRRRVMPQTVEAIDHAKAADVPIIVAVNKMDRPDANPERVLQQLSERGLVPEQWAATTIVVQISALQGTGSTTCSSSCSSVAEVEDSGRAPRPCRGVLEAELEVGRGPGGDGHRGERHAARR